MIIHILCPGPSISRWRGAQPGDPVIGVNLAALAYPWDCTWWACHDFEILERFAELHRTDQRSRQIYTSRHAIEMAPSAGLLAGAISCTDRDLGLRETDFTVIAAIKLAMRIHGSLSLGRPLAVQAWGCDLAGTSYGVPSNLSPREADWPRIRAQIAELLAANPGLIWVPA